MAKPIEALKAMRIGCDNVVVALLETDTAASILDCSNGAVTNASMKTAGLEYKKDKYFALPGVMALNINPNMSLEVAFFDDGPGDVASTLGAIEVSFNKSSLGPKEKALLLGKAITEHGLVCHGSKDIPPWVAIGFRTLRSDGTYRYVWLYKGKFMDPEDNNETKADSINFQSEEITGRFVKLNTKFKVKSIDPMTGDAVTDGKTEEIQAWKIEVEDLSDENAKKWFEQVQAPSTSIVAKADA
ncbi:MAG: major tail protein [Paraclostridium sp.]